MEEVQKRVQVLNHYADQIPPIVELSKKAKVQPGVILGGAIILLSLIVLILFGFSILTIVITVLYPGFKSIKALDAQ